MKKLIIPLCLLFFYQDEHNYTRTLFDQEIIYGKVKSFTEIQRTIKTDGTKPDSLIITRHYDANGNTTKETFKSVNHVPPNVDVFDVSGNIVKKRRLSKMLIFKYITLSDKDGGKITSYSESGQTENYQFDNNRRLTECKKYQLVKELLGRNIYKYDDRNRLIELKLLDSKDSLYEQFYYKYANNNYPTERHIYDVGQLRTITTYQYLKYDKAGNWIKRKEHEVEKEYTIEKVTTRTFTYFH